ncbi:hypothetical protein DM02DRAFT_516828 [Periconia macrospinosa]|uniref:Uncharacterized protein n=1 Tax=Periconia macrospinosa TaxID=97972 RepID=A0A2V1E4D2_9PLEO|nr:hypothetical protein DM02DRAFT_516828 [Periconia macrospinosa]
MPRVKYDMQSGCNPKAYERRAGHELPTLAFYRNDVSGLDRPEPMAFSQERFVIGFDLLCLDYYNIRQEVINRLEPQGLYKQGFSKAENKLRAGEIFEWLLSHPLLQPSKIPGLHIPLKWHFDILYGFIYRTASWMEDNEEHLRNGTSPAEKWHWGPHRLTPKHSPVALQFQYLLLMVDFPLQNRTYEVPVISIVEGRNGQITNTPLDINHRLIRLNLLQDRLSEDDDLRGLEPTFEFYWHAEGNQEIKIINDQTLVTAIKTLRETGLQTITIKCKCTFPEPPPKTTTVRTDRSASATSVTAETGDDHESGPRRSPRKKQKRKS